jgi:hypothetical protein
MLGELAAAGARAVSDLALMLPARRVGSRCAWVTPLR